MNLTAAELAYANRLDLQVTKECDGSERFLNQSLRYAITEKPEVYCSTVCREITLFGDLQQTPIQSPYSKYPATAPRAMPWHAAQGAQLCWPPSHGRNLIVWPERYSLVGGTPVDEYSD